MNTIAPLALLAVVAAGCSHGETTARTPPPVPPPPTEVSQQSQGSNVSVPQGNVAVVAPLQIDKFTCSQLLDTQKEDRAAGVLFFYGYVAGKHDMHELRTSQIAPNTTKVLDFCAQNPRSTVRDAFSRTLGK